MTDYNVMGMMALIPGIQKAIDRLEGFKEELLAAAAAARGETAANSSAREFIEQAVAKKRGRPPRAIDPVVTAAVAEAEKKFKHKSKKMKGYWASLTPEERTAEMRRRAAVAQARRKGDDVDVNKLHPRDPRSPRHAVYVKKLRKGQLDFWGKLSAEERAKRVNQMQNGRAA